MITHIAQCHTIQQYRVVNKKQGYAKAVRRFLFKEYGEKGYKAIKASLPVFWKKPIGTDKKPKTQITLNLSPKTAKSLGLK